MVFSTLLFDLSHLIHGVKIKSFILNLEETKRPNNSMKNSPCLYKINRNSFKLCSFIKTFQENSTFLNLEYKITRKKTCQKYMRKICLTKKTKNQCIRIELYHKVLQILTITVLIPKREKLRQTESITSIFKNLTLIIMICSVT